jgi:hypothetical protein
MNNEQCTKNKERSVSESSSRGTTPVQREQNQKKKEQRIKDEEKEKDQKT